jgi:hypothetical protein
MKRTFALIAAGLVVGAPAVARAQYETVQQQEDTVRNDRGWSFGIKGGLSWSNVSNRGLLPGELNERLGWALGIAFGTTGEPVSVGLEALYAQRGLDSDLGNDTRFDYIDVPAYLRFAIPTQSVAPYLFAGPQASFEIACDWGTLDCDDPNRDELTWAAVIGAGIRLGDASRFSVEGRYVYGLSDLRFSTITDENSYRTRSFMVLGVIGF